MTQRRMGRIIYIAGWAILGWNATSFVQVAVFLVAGLAIAIGSDMTNEAAQ